MKLQITKIELDNVLQSKSIVIENVENELPVKLGNTPINNLVILNYLQQCFNISATSTVKFNYVFDNLNNWKFCSYDFIQEPITKRKLWFLFSISKT